jgi:hypothetical protein
MSFGGGVEFEGLASYADFQAVLASLPVREGICWYNSGSGIFNIAYATFDGNLLHCTLTS